MFASIILSNSASALQFTMNSFNVTEDARHLSWSPIQTSPIIMNLEEGGSAAYDLFSFRYPDDLVYVGMPDWYWDISVIFDVSSPGYMQNDVEQLPGEALSNLTRVRWNQDAEFQFGNGGSFTIGLNDVRLNPSAVVQATFTYESSPVPEPSTIMLLVSGLVGIVGFGRKKFFLKSGVNDYQKINRAGSN